MTQDERREFLIRYLLDERGRTDVVDIPKSADEQRIILRALMNVRPAGLPSDEFLAVQDDYLQERIAEEGITRFEDLAAVAPHRYLWRGDITTLACDAIVNAANSGMTGCWQPNHNCIDNCIHTFAGVQLRFECAQLMALQGHEEPTGQALITGAYNLPSKRIIHTVGPIADGHPTDEHRRQLASCYVNCYRLARENDVQSLSYCCISTGVFGFPPDQAAGIATATVKMMQDYDVKQGKTPLDVIFTVFSDLDEDLYRWQLND